MWRTEYEGRMLEGAECQHHIQWCEIQRQPPTVPGAKKSVPCVCNPAQRTGLNTLDAGR